MKRKLFTLVLLAGGSLFAQTHWSIGLGRGSLLLPTNSATGGREHTAVSWS